MIVWINGVFGVGKTTATRELVAANDSLRPFDPEWVGFMLTHHLSDQEVSDFQDFPAWRRLVPVVADEVARHAGQHLVAVQSVLVVD